MTGVPERSEAAEYYFTYIDQVPAGDILETLSAQQTETLALLRGIHDDKSMARYAPDKWSVRDVVNHVNDCERLFVFRAFWFARGFESALPSFDQNVAATSAGAERRTWDSLIEEFQAVRSATLTFFRTLPADAWDQRGLASDSSFTVRALAYVTAGHVAHHVRILRELYFVS